MRETDVSRGLLVGKNASPLTRRWEGTKWFREKMNLQSISSGSGIRLKRERLRVESTKRESNRFRKTIKQ